MSSPVWSKEHVYFSQDDYFRDLIASINGARLSVEMETYIFERGVLADRVCEALCLAASRRVRVRLLIDGVGSPNFVIDYEDRLRSFGVDVRFYRTWPWILRRLPGEPRSLLGQMSYRLARLNKGNHRKMCLIDHKTLWVGSANVSDVHLQEIFGDRAWRDLGVCVEGEGVGLAKLAFEQAFKRGRSLRLRLRLPKLLAFNQSYYHRRLRRMDQLRRLERAKKRIWIETPYFVPLRRVMRRLRRKAKEGVDVRIMVPRQSDVWLIPWISYPYLRRLAAHGVKVFEYQPRFLHQKLYLIDDWVCLGSTNLNHRSFLHDLEIDVVITHAENIKALEDCFLDDQSHSIGFQALQWRTLPLWKRVFYAFTSYFAYWS